jgi:hypothetical protein
MVSKVNNEAYTPEQKLNQSLSQVVKDALSAKLYDMRFHSPGKVLRYDKDKQLVDVQPSFKAKTPSGKVVNPPAIYNVPVMFQRGGDAIISVPIKKGDSIGLFFCDRSIEKWLSNGGIVDPEDSRAHVLSDATAMPGLYPFNNNAKIANDDDVIIRNGKKGKYTEARFRRDGKFQIKNNQYEFVKEFDRLISVIRQAVVYTSTGPKRLRHLFFATQQARIRSFLVK